MLRAVEDWLPRHRITVHEYYRMGELELFAPDARTELIEGEIMDVASPGSEGKLHVFRSPCDGDYADTTSKDRPDEMAIAVLQGVTVDLSDVLH